MLVEVSSKVGPLPSSPLVLSAKPEALLVRYWRQIGGGSLLASVAIHAGLIVAAYFIVQTIVTEPKIDFMPNGGSQAGQDAAAQVQAQMKQKKQKSLSQSTPMSKVAVNAPSAISIPDVPMDLVELDSQNGLLGAAAAMGTGAFGSGGIGSGTSNGLGTGAVKGFLARTVFGKLGGSEGLPGKLYDFKQDRNRKPLEYTPAIYGSLLGKAAERRYSETALNDFYCAKQQVSFTFLTIPNMKAEEGPKAFQVEKEVEPRGWFVHYSGVISPPTPGEWRFMGLFDDVLIVYINNKVVFDGGYAHYSKTGNAKVDEDVRQEFGENFFGPRWPVRVGKWVRLEGSSKIDIIVGEVPGGSVGGALFVQHKNTKYRVRENGTPILPVFTTAKLDMEDISSIKKFNESTKFEIEPETPVFTVKKSLMEEASTLDRMKK
jgi:hypothetical protein